MSLSLILICRFRAEETPLDQTRIWMLATCFLVILLDGLDTASVALIAPVVSKLWGVAPAAFTPAFVATNAGAVVGYLICGPVSNRLGHRRTGILSVILFGTGTLLGALAYDVLSLSIIRFVAAIGLGGALPIAVATATAIVAPGFRAGATVLVATGLSAGSVVGGLITGPLVAKFGWPSIFIVGGLLPLLLLPLFARALSAAERAQAGPSAEPVAPNPIAALFADGRGVSTGLLWLFAFLIFLVTYGLSSWIPTLLVDFGFSPTQAPLGLAALGVGGIVGNLLMMLIVGRLGTRPALIMTSVGAIACILIISYATIPSSLLLVLIGAVGAGLITGCVGQSALAVSFYPGTLRTTGVGWAAAFGRLGSIAGPAVGGALLALHWSARDVILTAIPPIAAAIAVLLAMSLVRRSPALVEAVEH